MPLIWISLILIILIFFRAGSTKNTSASDVDSEEENEEGDYTVYECPGLAPVSINFLFQCRKVIFIKLQKTFVLH